MKKFILSAVALAVAAGGCAFMHPSGRKWLGSRSAGQAFYAGKASLKVAELEIAAPKAGSAIGNGIRRMLITALLNSGRFSIAESQPKGQGQQADLMISAAVVEFEPQASGGTAGIGGGGGACSGLMGGLLGPLPNKAHLALDIKIVDTANSRVLASTRVRGQAIDKVGGVMAGFSGGWKIDPRLVSYANTPMEKAIRICIIETVRYVSSSIPDEYYKY